MASGQAEEQMCTPGGNRRYGIFFEDMEREGQEPEPEPERVCNSTPEQVAANGGRTPEDKEKKVHNWLQYSIAYKNGHKNSKH